VEKINIDFKDFWRFEFNKIPWYKGIERCPYCSYMNLHRTYTYIIDSLKDAGLLYEGYKKICCYCAILKRLDMLDLSDNLNTIEYDYEDDILTISFTFFTKVNGNTERQDIGINIHDWSKIGGVNNV